MSTQPFPALDRLSTAEIIEICDGLKHGRLRVELMLGIEKTPELTRWLEDCRAAMVDAYSAVLERRLS